MTMWGRKAEATYPQARNLVASAFPVRREKVKMVKTARMVKAVKPLRFKLKCSRLRWVKRVKTMFQGASPEKAKASKLPKPSQTKAAPSPKMATVTSKGLRALRMVEACQRPISSHWKFSPNSSLDTAEMLPHKFLKFCGYVFEVFFSKVLMAG